MDQILSQVTELFHRLRQTEASLGIDQYLLMTEALRMGYGQVNEQPDREALRRLCRLLWLEGQEAAPLFEHHFNAAMASLPAVTAAESSVADSSEIVTTTNERETAVAPKPGAALPDESSTPEIAAESEPVMAEVNRDTEASAAAEAVQLAERTPDPLANLHAVLFDSGAEQEVDYQRFILTADYLPVSSRQMKQNWRYLRRMTREGPPVELDVPATIRQVSQHGFLLDPILRPHRVNKASLLLLLDQNGSMVPFHALGRRLQETALDSGSLARVRAYYFHNSPPIRRDGSTFSPRDLYREHNLYVKPQCVGAQSLLEILTDFKNSPPAVLIFSDAGAARGGWSEDRIQKTATFVYQLLACGIEHIAWLNPLPSTRWLDETNSATAIADFTPMFSMNREGMYRAIQVLRGHSTQKVKL